MAVVVTPPTIGIQEASSKNWYKAEALRKVVGDLTVIRDDIADADVYRRLKIAIGAIEAARCILNPQLKPIKRVRTRE